ncbi:hypothetical protein [Klebsiella michiganensis]|uniref:hypothetical protein n=1 Tax=Klebsiella michiganensis TaxID=1134687 RepID=UPI003EE1BDFF
MINLTEQTEHISLDEIENVEFILLNNISVNIAHKNFHIGSLHYKKVVKEGRYLYADEYVSLRISMVRLLMKTLIIKYDCGTISHKTLAYRLSRFISFIRWCNGSSLGDCLDNENGYIECYNSYLKYLSIKVRKGTYKSTSANSTLIAIKYFLYDIVNESLHNKIDTNLIINNDSMTTKVPSDIDVSRNIQLLESIFLGVYNFIIKSEKYPYALSMPSFLGFENNSIWIFPSKVWCFPYYDQHGFSNGEKNKYLNYKYGRAITEEEFELFNPELIEHKNRLINRTQRNIEKANDNSRHVAKISLVKLASAAFTLLFIANTGMNPTQCLNLEWSREYEKERISSKFTTIKYRANNKKVNFTIASIFFDYFKKYLSLREYLLNGQMSEKLFIPLTSRQETLLSFDYIANLIRGFYNNICPMQRLLTPREWRVLKAEWFINNSDIKTTAMHLQNSERTVSRHYSNGTVFKQSTELTTFLSKISNVRIVENNEVVTEIATGWCSSPGNPVGNNLPNNIKQDCRGPNGCLFCEKFAIHVDEKDLLKLLSYKYCIEQTIVLSSSIEHWDKLYSEVLTRIDQIINEVSVINKDLVFKIQKKIKENTVLDPYWERKLAMLVEIGAL